jgi:hypothetical protein
VSIFDSARIYEFVKLNNVEPFGASNMIITSRNPCAHYNVCAINFYPTKTTEPILSAIDDGTYSMCHIMSSNNYRPWQFANTLVE